MNDTSTSDVNAIEVRIETISQLFFNLDPSPFREKDLDKDAEEFIVSWARELPSEAPVKIVVHLPLQELERPEAEEIGPAITQFFRYRAQVIGYEIRELFRIGWRSLVVGTAVLLLSITAGQTIAASLNPAPLGELIEQSLLIFAWVANWRPIEIFLYEWWPIARRRDLYRRLAEAKVELSAYRPGEHVRSALPRR
jgi:hypothetical protein